MSSQGEDGLPAIPPRERDSHKGDYGRVVLIGGSRGMSGAIALAGMAALRSGAGLVTLATADRCLDTVALFEPSYMTQPLPNDEQGRIAEQAFDAIVQVTSTADAVAIGPGLGRSEGLTRLVARLFQELAKPLVVDADALNALAEAKAPLDAAPAPRILTPHPGEFRRLAAQDGDRDEQQKQARSLAGENLIILLKGADTFITNGEREAINETGNPGMATGGSGDVLTGVITALVGQGFAPYDAARLGAHIHGAAGDLAAEDRGQVSMIASDLIDSLSEIEF